MQLDQLLDQKAVRQYLARLKAQGVPPATIERKLASIRRFSSCQPTRTVPVGVDRPIKMEGSDPSIKSSVTKKSAEADLVRLTDLLTGWTDNLNHKISLIKKFVKYQASLPSPRRFKFITTYAN
ncbi:MAG: hypothetical protein U1C50_04170 [Patescibacteria group bacterium]|nr:hypothetical protein [Patescibacteria group bacterium]